MASTVQPHPSWQGGDAVEMQPTSGINQSDYSYEKGRMANAEISPDTADVDDDDEAQDVVDKTTKSTRADAHNMQRMGRTQQLVRHFRLLSVASFAAIATAVWEIGLFEISPGLTDGGRPALVYSVLWNFIGFGPIYISMAEMASMAPIAGAQYHWVSEFAPEALQKPLSYFTG
jgi:choline transport protein